MVKLIWFNLIFIGIVFSILTGNNITETIIKVPNEALSICLQIFPNIALWLGIMKIAENAGLIDKLAKITSKIIRPLFKEIPENHKSLGYISSNIVINIAPHPYIGQYGPIINPLLINFFASIDLQVTSIIQPATA